MAKQSRAERMSTEKSDGGAAFPVGTRDWPGMTPRDYFAAAVAARAKGAKP